MVEAGDFKVDETCGSLNTHGKGPIERGDLKM